MHVGTENPRDAQGLGGIPSFIDALGAIRAFQEYGLSVPENIAVIGFDDLPVAAANRLTTVRQPIHDLGTAALHGLIDLVEGRIAPPLRLLLPTELVFRQSCPAS